MSLTGGKTFFSEGLGNPALEYMLCANAARLAQGKGLHRRPASTWNLTKQDALHFSWLFWAIYYCDKHIAHRSGRPSVSYMTLLILYLTTIAHIVYKSIDDDNISCEIPTEICPGSTLDIQACTWLFRHAQLSSLVSQKLMSVKAFQQSAADLLQTVTDLDLQLRRWRDSLPGHIRPPDRLMAFQEPLNSQPHSIVLTHLAYYGTMMAIHTMSAYPWISSTILENDKSAVTQDQTVSSSNAVAEAARNIIILSRNLGVNAASIQW